MVLIETVNQPERPCSRKVRQLHLIWIGVHLIPMLIEHTGELLEIRSLVVLPCIITVEDDLHMLIDSVKGVYRVIWRCDKRLQRLQRRSRYDEFRLYGIQSYRICCICYARQQHHCC